MNMRSFYCHQGKKKPYTDGQRPQDPYSTFPSLFLKSSGSCLKSTSKSKISKTEAMRLGSGTEFRIFTFSYNLQKFLFQYTKYGTAIPTNMYSYIAISPIYSLNLPLILITANQWTNSHCFLGGSLFLLIIYLYSFSPNLNPKCSSKSILSF